MKTWFNILGTAFMILWVASWFTHSSANRESTLIFMWLCFLEADRR